MLDETLKSVDWNSYNGLKADVLDQEHTPPTWIHNCTFEGIDYLNPDSKALPFLKFLASDGRVIDVTLNEYTSGNYVFLDSTSDSEVTPL